MLDSLTVLDLQDQSICTSTTQIMSRKRTRSKSEEIVSGQVTTISSPVPRVQFFAAAPYTEDEGPTKLRAETEYTKITYDMAKSGQASRPVRVYADGAFDLFHQGHAKVLLQAKRALPEVYLIVGVCSDRMLHKMKGKTVLNEEERYNAVRHCRYVDEVLREAPWCITDDFLKKHKIDFVAHDDLPYPSGDQEDIYTHLKKKGMFLATERTEGVSTSDIVARIVKDYDVYVRRNLARGYSAKELNVSFIKEKKFRMLEKMDELKNKGKEISKEVKHNVDNVLQQWEDKSKDVIDGFLSLFTKKKLRNIWTNSKGKIMKAITPAQSDNSESSSDPEDEATPAKRIRYNLEN